MNIEKIKKTNNKNQMNKIIAVTDNMKLCICILQVNFDNKINNPLEKKFTEI